MWSSKSVLQHFNIKSSMLCLIFKNTAITVWWGRRLEQWHIHEPVLSLTANLWAQLDFIGKLLMSSVLKYETETENQTVSQLHTTSWFFLMRSVFTIEKWKLFILKMPVSRPPEMPRPPSPGHYLHHLFQEDTEVCSSHLGGIFF